MRKFLYVLLIALYLLTSCGDNGTPTPPQTPSSDDNQQGSSQIPSLDFEGIALDPVEVPSTSVKFTGTAIDMTGKRVLLIENETETGIMVSGLDSDKVYCSRIIAEDNTFGMYNSIYFTGEISRTIWEEKILVYEVSELPYGKAMDPVKSKVTKNSEGKWFADFYIKVKASDVTLADKSNIYILPLCSMSGRWTYGYGLLSGEAGKGNKHADLSKSDELIIYSYIQWDDTSEGYFTFLLENPVKLNIGQDADLATPAIYTLPANDQEYVLEMDRSLGYSHILDSYSKDWDTQILPSFMRTDDKIFYYIGPNSSDREFEIVFGDWDAHKIMDTTVSNGLKLRQITEAEKAQILHINFTDTQTLEYTINSTSLESFISSNPIGYYRHIPIVFTFPEGYNPDTAKLTIELSDLTYRYCQAAVLFRGNDRTSTYYELKLRTCKIA